MHRFFKYIYSIFAKRKKLVYTFILLLFGLLILYLWEIKLEEDITTLIPKDDRISEMSETFTSSSFSDQIIFTISLIDTTQINTDRLIQEVDSLSNFLNADSIFVKEVRSSVDQSSIVKVYDFFYQNIPLYMSDADYQYIDTIMIQKNLDVLMRKNYRSIISPTGFGTSKFILKDPLSIVPRFLKRLQSFKLDENFVLHKSRIFTKDKKNAFVFVDPLYSSKNTKQNRNFINHIDEYIASVPNDVSIKYYGGTAVAVANANRVQSDIYLTISIAVTLLILLFMFVFRSIKIVVVMFLPMILGMGISLAFLSFMYEFISVIALGVGAVLLGIAIDYSLHYYSHIRTGQSPKEILSAISNPVMMSSLTSVSAFLCLTVVNSEALNQLGIFAGVSIFVASILVLLLLPLLSKHRGKVAEKQHRTLFDNFANYDFHKQKFWIIGVFVLSIAFVFTGKYLKFDANIANLNYLPAHLDNAKKNLEQISTEASSAIYVVALGSSMDVALQKLERNDSLFHLLENQQIIDSKSGVGTLLMSRQRQEVQIERWNRFWEDKGIETTLTSFKQVSENNHFSEGAFNSFISTLHKTYEPISELDFKEIRNLFLKNLINEKSEEVALVSVCKVNQKNKPIFFEHMANADDLLVLDKQFFTSQFFKVLKEDFSKLISYSMVVVFLIILLFWGRIELALITFIPVALSWQWTIGLMGLFDVHFNIFNIIICTFIFGLGIDYSIFITQGLVNNYKYGNKSIHPYKVSVLLSVCTTLIGVGVLIFAQHPALKSIAIVAILGISSVVLITFTVLPFLFNWLVKNKSGRRILPIVAIDVFVSLTSFAIFLIGVIFLSALVIIFRITPFFRKGKKKIIHYLLCMTCKLVVGVNFLFKIEHIERYKLNLSEPTVIISNHQSHLDIALILLMSPKIIVLTNEWVWNNIFYGLIIRYIDFYPIHTGIDSGYDKIKAKVDQGYSVLVFPEGTRTKNGKINRFHQGAFSLADYLGIDIFPILLHGAYECLPKTEFILRAGHITLKFYDKIKVKKVDIEKGITYRQQAKEVTAFYRKEMEQMKVKKENASFFSHKLINQYIYKGPVLEWYLRVKIKLEKHYKFFDELLPRQCKIIDVGCGYGFMANMLSYTATDREIIGWDYDIDKVKVAQEVAREDQNISFVGKDIVTDEFESTDVFVFNDVLHYLSEEQQMSVLKKATDNLNSKGFMVIRDADTELKKRTKVTRLSEFFSIKLLAFNKMKYELSYFSSSRIRIFAQENNLSFTKVDNSKYTSNLIYILKKES